MTREHAVQFGDSDRLTGIFATPSEAPVKACLGLVNSGFIPRSGPHRVYSQLARRLADSGIASLRFDLGGLGDSLASNTGFLRERTHADVAAAVALMAERFPGAELMLGGICSGAEDSFQYAEMDARVARVVLVDPFAYRTFGWHWRHALHRLHRRALRGLGLWEHSPNFGASDIINYQYMPVAESIRILRATLRRGMQSHFIYTSGRRESFNHAAQFKRMFPGLETADGATVDFLPGIGHTQLLQEDRDVLLATIARRLISPAVSRAPNRG